MIRIYDGGGVSEPYTPTEFEILKCLLYERNGIHLSDNILIEIYGVNVFKEYPFNKKLGCCLPSDFEIVDERTRETLIKVENNHIYSKEELEEKGYNE